MKYGQQFERESVPEWSLHNLDYNSLKHEIKVHTTRDQATAMVIPGHIDPALLRFEDALYAELCTQHERLQLFVTSKADEVSRRLDHLGKSIRRWTASAEHREDSTSFKYQRKFAKYEREMLRCGGDIQGLSRFAHAQVVAFRKLIKKYKKWTGSTTLGSRFNENVLSDPKSFTRRDFSPLQVQYDEISHHLHAVAPVVSEPSSPDSVPPPISDTDAQHAQRQITFDPLPPPKMAEQPKYWNEYDDGSEAGNPEEYAIYINPDEDMSFPGVEYVRNVFRASMAKARVLFRLDTPAGERQPLLVPDRPSTGYSSTFAGNDSDEDGYTSSEGFPPYGYVAHYALPSLGQQQAARYREDAFFYGTIWSFAVSFILLGVAGVLISTGKHKLRTEVDAGVAVGVVSSLLSSCVGLGLTMYRRDPLSSLYRMVVFSSFATSCFLNGMLLVLIVDNSP